MIQKIKQYFATKLRNFITENACDEYAVTDRGAHGVKIGRSDYDIENRGKRYTFTVSPINGGHLVEFRHYKEDSYDRSTQQVHFISNTEKFDQELISIVNLEFLRTP